MRNTANIWYISSPAFSVHVSIHICMFFFEKELILCMYVYNLLFKKCILDIAHVNMYVDHNCLTLNCKYHGLLNSLFFDILVIYQSTVVMIMLYNRQPQNLSAIQRQALNFLLRSLQHGRGGTDSQWGGWGSSAPRVLIPSWYLLSLMAPSVVCSSHGDDNRNVQMLFQPWVASCSPMFQCRSKSYGPAWSQGQEYNWIHRKGHKEE